MIFVTGDCHFNFTKLNFRNFPEARRMTKDDVLLICGDFGIGPWINNEKENEYWLNWLEQRPFTVAFCDGNHENFDVLDAMPVREWNGGKVHFVRPHVIHLMRGQYYEINGKTIWAFGGARSHDIQDGILDPDDPDFRRKRSELDRRYGVYRINHWTWWQQEMPSDYELREGLKNLASHGNRVDYIMTHCAPSRIQEKFMHEAEKDELTGCLDTVFEDVSYDHWYFGHYHAYADSDIDERHTILYHSIVQLGKGVSNDASRVGAFRRGQWVSAMISGMDKPIQGKIIAVDRLGGGIYSGMEPSADILTDDRRLLKNVPFSSLKPLHGHPLEE